MPLKPYRIDPDVLARIAEEVVGETGDSADVTGRAVELLSAEYPDLVDSTPGRWVGSKAGGILGKVRFLYFSPREYIVLFSSPHGHPGILRPLQARRDPQISDRGPDRFV